MTVSQLGDADSLSRPVVIAFSSAAEKYKVFHIKGRLNDYTGNQGSKIYLNEYLPPHANEKKRRERDLRKTAKDNPSRADLKVEYTERGLKVGSELYKKKVLPPDPLNLLDLTTEEYDRIMDISVTTGPRVRIENDIFMAFSCDATDHKVIRDVYTKLKLSYARAKHIVCAYNLEGKSPHYDHDHADDGEHGAGRIILDILKSNQIKQKAVFIARFSRDGKIGGKRTKGYTDAVQKLFEVNNFNKVLSTHQPINPDLGKQKKSVPAQPQKAKHTRKYNVRSPSVRGGSTGGRGGMDRSYHQYENPNTKWDVFQRKTNNDYEW